MEIYTPRVISHLMPIRWERQSAVYIEWALNGVSHPSPSVLGRTREKIVMISVKISLVLWEKYSAGILRKAYPVCDSSWSLFCISLYKKNLGSVHRVVLLNKGMNKNLKTWDDVERQSAVYIMQSCP